jgi:ATP-dependent Lon protease
MRMTDELPILFDFPDNLEDEIPQELQGIYELPVLPLNNLVLFPHMLTSLYISDSKLIAMIELALQQQRFVLTVAQQENDPTEIDPANFYQIGVIARIQRVLRMPDDAISLIIQGMNRVEILDVRAEQEILVGHFQVLFELYEPSLSLEAMRRSILRLYEKVSMLSHSLPDDAYVMALNVDQPGWLADLITATIPLSVAQRQSILEILDAEERLRMLAVILTNELEILELEHQIQSQVQREVNSSQREFYLREQLKVILQELGQRDPQQRDLNDLETKIQLSLMPEAVQTRVNEEFYRLSLIPTSSPEYSVLRMYIEYVVELPWQQYSVEQSDITKAAQILDSFHYGLQDIKDRLLEFIAVALLSKSVQHAPILCFVGPPGVGKTSLGQALAEALGRKLVRVSLGGLRDEAEIRGHRRTYIGAMPGRIIKAMREAGTSNPVMVLDELDKLGSDFRGDPASALLEVLDPEQRHNFVDHYLDMPFDLSHVLFVATANTLDTIQDALRDRLEIIHIPSYTEEEKLQIAKQFLIPKQLKLHSLDEDSSTTPAAEYSYQLRFSDTALREIIQNYTYEAGVRNLERNIATICRKIVRQLVEGRRVPHSISPNLLSKYLGSIKHTNQKARTYAEIGVATGLFWTPNGGDILTIEIVSMPGKGQIQFTGQLGDVMRESAQAAYAYVRSHAQQYHIDNAFFSDRDFHIHVPEGAIRKDGPSAGVALVTAMISSLTVTPIHPEMAVTGEITLTGRVLAVGGVKEKILGAYRAGIRHVVLPLANASDLQELPKSVHQGIQFTLIQHVHEALNHLFVHPNKRLIL